MHACTRNSHQERAHKSSTHCIHTPLMASVEYENQRAHENAVEFSWFYIQFLNKIERKIKPILKWEKQHRCEHIKNGLHLLREVVCLRVLNIYYISAIFYSILKAEEHCIGHKRSERENHIKTQRQTAWSFYSQKKCVIKINRKTERSKALFLVRSLFGERQRTKTKYEEKWEPTKNNATDQATEKWPVWIRSSIDAKRNRI